MIKPDIFADIQFYKTKAGDRVSPTSDIYFGCIINVAGRNYDARMFLEEIGSIHPGDVKRNVPIKFLDSERSLDIVAQIVAQAGKFFISEGRIIGEGIVRKVVK